MSAAASPGFYQRRSLNVDTYDALAAIRSQQSTIAGDVEFYVDLARRFGGPVLELGCGTGRVSWALATAGFDTVGLDLSAAMLERAEAKRGAAPADVGARMTFVEGDMTAFELDRRFRLVVVPFRAFMALLEPTAQRACLVAVRRHLQPGGRLVLDLFDPRLDLLLPTVDSAPGRERDTVRHPKTGNDVTIDIVSRTNDTFHQRFRETWRFREVDPDGAVVRDEEEILELRWTFRWEMRYLLELCGFEVDAEYGDFHGAPPAYPSEQIWVARPASAPSS